MFPIVGVAVGISQGDDLLLLACDRAYLEDLVERLIAHPQIAGRIPDRPFREAEAGSHLGQLCFAVE
jgi:hypothetical protein